MRLWAAAAFLLPFGPVARGAGVENIAGAALAQPAVCSSRSCALSLGPVSYVGPATAFTTR